MDYYQILGISDNATSAQIKRAYRSLVKVYHPDINPSMEAKVRIREITIAYEVLSNPIAKQQYDLQRYYGHQTQYQRPTEPSPEEIRRRAYKQRKAAEERQRLEYLWQLKSRFYRVQRFSCYAFVVVSLIFSIDYFFMSKQTTEVVQKVTLRKWGNGYETNITTGNFRIATSRAFYDEYDAKRKPYVQIYYSSVFDIPSQIGFFKDDEIRKFSIYGTLHTYGNVFSYVLLIISMVIIRKKRYADWALTLAILPFFIVAFLMLFVVAA